MVRVRHCARQIEHVQSQSVEDMVFSKLALGELLRSITPMQRIVVAMRHDLVDLARNHTGGSGMRNLKDKTATMTFAEIASVLGISTSAANQYYLEGIKRLYNLLRNQ